MVNCQHTSCSTMWPQKTLLLCNFQESEITNDSSRAKSHSSIQTYTNFGFKNFAKHFYQRTKFRVVTKIVTAVREHTMKEKLSVCT